MDSRTGGKRFAVPESESDSDDKEIDVDKLQTEIPALKLDNAHYEKKLEQAQGKLVLLATALHGTWNILNRYTERMAEWSSTRKSCNFRDGSGR